MFYFNTEVIKETKENQEIEKEAEKKKNNLKIEKAKLSEEKIEKTKVMKKEQEDKKTDILKTLVEDLGISPRIAKVLIENKIKTLEKLVKKSDDDLQALPGMGDKGIKEIKKLIGKSGLTLKNE